jgi:hypothetical protein
MANKIKTNPETPIYFQSSGAASPPAPPPGQPPSPVIAFTAEGLGSGVGRVSDRHDLGTGPRTTLFEWRAVVTVSSGTLTLGYPVEFYMATSDGTLQDGPIGINDATLSVDKRSNLMFIGGVIADAQPNGSINYQSSGLIEIYGRYINLVWWNNLALPLSNTVGSQLFILTPVPDEIQNNA